MSGMVSISERVLELTEEGPRLRGARCTNCGNHVFPAQSGCARCAGASMAPAYLGTEGTLWAWTVQGFPPRSPPYLGPNDPDTFRPYGVGYVTLSDQLKVEARLTESDPRLLRAGMPMRLTVVPLYQDDQGRDVVTFAFAPSDSGDAQ